MTIVLSKQQGAAVDAVMEWMLNGGKVFKLAGYAGSGKTSIAKFIAEAVGGDILYGAFTGKAASVLESKGCSPASTIHRMLYRARLDERTGVWSFGKDPDSPARAARLVIIDEVSMLSEDLGLDLLSTARKILVLGDPGQLPPIKGEPFFDMSRPDFMLTEIHRQAAESPIIRLATDVRNGKSLTVGAYGDSVVKKNKQFVDEDMRTHEQTLVGRNATRAGLNARYRKAAGADSYLPRVDDRLICLRNSREKGYLNGEMFTIDELTYESDAVETLVSPWGREGNQLKLLTFNEYFCGMEADLSWKQKLQNDEFCYGYAVTVHKYQGSQATSICLVDESFVFKENAAKWLYTGLTRASDRVTVFI